MGSETEAERKLRERYEAVQRQKRAQSKAKPAAPQPAAPPVAKPAETTAAERIELARRALEQQNRLKQAQASQASARQPPAAAKPSVAAAPVDPVEAAKRALALKAQRGQAPAGSIKRPSLKRPAPSEGPPPAKRAAGPPAEEAAPVAAPPPAAAPAQPARAPPPKPVPKGPPSSRHSLHVSGLPPWAADEDLMGACQEAGHGRVVSAYIIPGTDYGFVVLDSAKAMESALQGPPFMLGGRPLVARPATAKEPANGKGMPESAVKTEAARRAAAEIAEQGLARRHIVAPPERGLVTYDDL